MCTLATLVKCEYWFVVWRRFGIAHVLSFFPCTWVIFWGISRILSFFCVVEVSWALNAKTWRNDTFVFTGVYLELLTLLRFWKRWLTVIETVNYNAEHFLAICTEVFKIHLYDTWLLLMIFFHNFFSYNHNCKNWSEKVHLLKTQLYGPDLSQWWVCRQVQPMVLECKQTFFSQTNFFLIILFSFHPSTH